MHGLVSVNGSDGVRTTVRRAKAAGQTNIKFRLTSNTVHVAAGGRRIGVRINAIVDGRHG